MFCGIISNVILIHGSFYWHPVSFYDQYYMRDVCVFYSLYIDRSDLKDKK